MPEGPDYKPTVPFETVPDWAVKLVQRVEGVASDVGDIKLSLKEQGDHLQELEEWRHRTSDRVRGASQTDIEQTAQLVQERLAREEVGRKVDDLSGRLDKNTAITLDVKALLDKPIVRQLGIALVGLLLALATYLTGYFQARSH
jgi:hypothetical protein